MEFTIEGLDQLVRQLEKAGQDVEKGKEEALVAGAEVMQKETKNSAPRRTGNLILNIEISPIDGEEIFVFVDNQGKAYYGHMLENGTSKMAARPFMGPAFNRSRLKISQAMANKLRQRLGWGL